MELKLKLANSAESALASIAIGDDDCLENLYNQIEHIYGLTKSDCVLLSKNGIKLNSKSILNHGDVVQLCPTVLGGKGGFGSLLRAFGKQITKSTNKEACRDLTGRRIKHVNKEKKLKDFLSKQSEISKKKEEERTAKLDRKRKKREKLESTHHLFVDPKYDEQKQKITEDLDAAISTAIANNKLKKNTTNAEKSSSDNESSNSGSENSSSNGSVGDENSTQPQTSGFVGKLENAEKSVENGKLEKKPKEDKFKDWLGVGDLEVSSSSDEDDEPAKKIKKI